MSGLDAFGVALLLGAVCYSGYRLGSWRVALAFAVAPIAAPLVWAAAHNQLPHLPLLLLLAYPAQLVPGILVYILLRHFGRLQVAWVIVADALLAASIAVLFHLEYPDGGSAAPAFCLYGALAGTVFWLIAFAAN